MTNYTELVKALREKANSLYNASRFYDGDAKDAAILYKAAYAIEKLSKRIGNAVEYDYAEIVRELRQDASTSRDLYLADAIEALSVECKEWKERGDALEKTLNVAFSDFAKIEKNQSWISVAEKLPEPWEPVLVTYLGYNSHLPKADMLAYIDSDDGLWYWWDAAEPSGTKCIVTITHWMPLPEAPKEET